MCTKQTECKICESKVIELKREIFKFTVIVADFKTFFKSTTNGITGQKSARKYKNSTTLSTGCN